MATFIVMLRSGGRETVEADRVERSEGRDFELWAGTDCVAVYPKDLVLSIRRLPIQGNPSHPESIS